MIYIITVILIVFYLASLFGCITYMVYKDIDTNILAIFIVLCPILNTYFVFKVVNFKETMQKLKGDEECNTKDLWKKADGEDLPEFDKGVIALQRIISHYYRVVFTHRPADTIHVKTYGEGGWNIPDIKWWLDLELPIEY